MIQKQYMTNLLTTLSRLGLVALLAAPVAGVAFAQDKEEPEEPAVPPRLGPPGPGGRGLIPPGGPMVPPAEEDDEKVGGVRTPTPAPSISDAPEGRTGSVDSRRMPCVEPTEKVNMDFADAALMEVTIHMAKVTCRNFILSDDLKGQITIVSHQKVSVAEAYEAYLSALEVAGYTTVTVGKNTKVIPTSKAANTPLRVYQDGEDAPATDNFVTQLIQLENVTVADISTVVKDMAGTSAKVIGYNPTNTLIITDSAFNIRRVYRIVKQLDVAAPKSELKVIPLRHAAAADVERILEDVYGVTVTTSASSASATTGANRSTTRRKRDEEAAASSATATTVGAEGSYISKIISDERTNSLIVLANAEAIVKIETLIQELDKDIDPASRSQIHVIYLEHAKAEDVASVLSSLSGGSGSSSSRASTTGARTSTTTTNRNRSTTGGASGTTNYGRPGQPGGAGPEGGGLAGGVGLSGSTTSVVAAFDGGLRVTADDNTNSLVIIAAPEDFRVLRSVIDKLDIPRRQVYVEAVVVEVGSNDDLELGVGYHAGNAAGEGSLGYASGQLNGNSAGLPITDTGALLSGLAMGVLGPALSVAVPNPLSPGETLNLSIPAFGIALSALATNSEVNILSNPNLLVVDNEEATITVGRNVPFPVSSGYSTSGLPVTSYQREDVGITLKVTPQINESNYVTMEISLEVAEVEEDSSSLVDVNTAGFITSKRETENVVVVRDNQTIVIGGLIGNTQTKVQTKVPILGDIPLIGVLFRGTSTTERKTNLLIFLTPHVINEPADLEEVYRIKMAQREEFLRRFYGKSRDEQERELATLMQSSMNLIDRPSTYRTKAAPIEKEEAIQMTPVVEPAPAPAAEPVPEPAAEP